MNSHLYIASRQALQSLRPLLTPRETQVVQLLHGGLINSAIGEKLGTSEQVIKNYLRRIFDKTGTFNRLELALWWEKQTFL